MNLKFLIKFLYFIVWIVNSVKGNSPSKEYPPLNPTAAPPSGTIAPTAASPGSGGR